MIIKYKSAVLVPAGWRSIDITAKVELNKSGKKGTIIDVIDVDGDGSKGYTSRTGAKRQKYNIDYIVKRELASIKLISKCEVVEP
jgi:hypothetical protein